MAKILYGIAGEGRGHAARSKEIISHLCKNHEVLVVTWGKAYDMLKDEFQVCRTFGLPLTIKNGKILLFRTALDNIKKALLELPKDYSQLRKLVNEFKPDIVISDFEPLSARLASKYGIPLISIDNQHMLTNCRLDFPKKYLRDYLISKMVVKGYGIKADEFFITSFHNPKIILKNTCLFPPILRKEVLKAKPKKGDYILMYQSGNGDEKTLDVLKNVDEKFIVYGFNREGKDNNLTFKRFSESGFLKDLAGCKWVISTAGFSLISESLYLKKPLLVIPVGHFEQTVNSIYLKKLGYGDYDSKLSEKIIRDFISNLSRYENALKSYSREDNSRIFSRLDSWISSRFRD